MIEEVGVRVGGGSGRWEGVSGGWEGVAWRRGTCR